MAKKAKAETNVAKEAKTETDANNPYPAFSHPTEAEVRLVHDGLMAMHPEILEVKAQKRAADKGGCGVPSTTAITSEPSAVTFGTSDEPHSCA